MRYCLINLPSPFLADEKVFPNLGLLYISAFLKENGHDVEVVEDVTEIPEADVYGISSVTPQYGIASKLASTLDAFTMVGGSHATVAPCECIKDFDMAVVGDGEMAALHPTAGIIARPWSDHLDKVPFPDRDAIDIHSYKYYLDGRACTTMVTSRGCPFECAFCCKIHRGVRYRSAENIIREIDILKHKYGFDALMFFDDIFISKKKRLKLVGEALKRWGIIWRCFVRADMVDNEICKILSDCGCVEVGMGVESGSPKILKAANKGETIEQVEAALTKLYNSGIRVKVFMIVGLPGESADTISETEAFLNRNRSKVFDFDFTIYAPYPGSCIADNLADYDITIESQDYDKMYYKGKPGSYAPTIRTTALSSQEILGFRDSLEKEYKIWT